MVKNSRVGKTYYNNFGSKMVIIEYRGALDIDVYFPEYDYVYKNTRYDAFNKGQIRCPFERTFYHTGYIGEGSYKAKVNGKPTKCFKTWNGMLERCYSSKFQSNHPTYIDCRVCDEWHNFQNFAQWYEENYYEVNGEQMELDKDILNKKNKVYNPQYCMFVPKYINTLILKNDKHRGDLPIGVNYSKGYYMARLSTKQERKYLGLYPTPRQAFQVYKTEKEKYIKQIADEYRDFIPLKLYNALYRYEVEITD